MTRGIDWTKKLTADKVLRTDEPAMRWLQRYVTTRNVLTVAAIVLLFLMTGAMMNLLPRR